MRLHYDEFRAVILKLPADDLRRLARYYTKLANNLFEQAERTEHATRDYINEEQEKEAMLSELSEQIKQTKYGRMSKEHQLDALAHKYSVPVQTVEFKLDQLAKKERKDEKADRDTYIMKCYRKGMSNKKIALEVHLSAVHVGRIIKTRKDKDGPIFPFDFRKTSDKTAHVTAVNFLKKKGQKD